VNVRYQPVKNTWWNDFTWPYDSGLVVGAVNGISDASALTAAQQSAIGFYCGSDHASLARPITSCPSSVYGAERIQVLAPGTKKNDDQNPLRVKPGNVVI
jgi:hypothetical protein